jgi:hypothetical protein
MKYVCREYIEPDKLETTSERGRSGLPFRNGKGLKQIRTNLVVTPIPPSTALTRAYFRAVRAAEMAAWEMTGGDCLLSSCVAQDLGS